MSDDIFPTVEDVPLELLKTLVILKNNPSTYKRRLLFQVEIDDLLNNKTTAEVILANCNTQVRSERSVSRAVSEASNSRMGSSEPTSRRSRAKEGSNQPPPAKRARQDDTVIAPEVTAPAVLKPRLEPGMPKSCNLCGYEELRILDYGRKDGKHVLECANRNCLKSLGLTNAMVGRIGPQADEYPTSQWGWYLRDPMDLYYPSKQVQNMYNEEAQRLEDYYQRHPETERPSPFVKKIEDGQEVMYIRCPGQTKLCRVD